MKKVGEKIIISKNSFKIGCIAVFLFYIILICLYSILSVQAYNDNNNNNNKQNLVYMVYRSQCNEVPLEKINYSVGFEKKIDKTAVYVAQTKTVEFDMVESTRACATDEEVIMLAKLIYGEAGICKTTKEKAAVVWCVLNRLDDNFGKTIYEIITAPRQFAGFSWDNPVFDEYVGLTEDVLKRYELEKLGYENVGRVLPKEYKWFESDYRYSNIFKTHYLIQYAKIWDFSLEDPYLNN